MASKLLGALDLHRTQEMFARTEPLDGSRLLDTSSDKLWLVFAGRRHHVTTIGVHEKLFRKSVFIKRVNGDVVDEVKEGPELLYGSCLVRVEKRATISLLAVFPTRVVLHPIPNTAVFEKYGFDYELCQTIPDTLFSKMSLGRPLS